MQPHPGKWMLVNNITKCVVWSGRLVSIIVIVHTVFDQWLAGWLAGCALSPLRIYQPDDKRTSGSLKWVTEPVIEYMVLRSRVIGCKADKWTCVGQRGEEGGGGTAGWGAVTSLVLAQDRSSVYDLNDAAAVICEGKKKKKKSHSGRKTSNLLCLVHCLEFNWGDQFAMTSYRWK